MTKYTLRGQTTTKGSEMATEKKIKRRRDIVESANLITLDGTPARVAGWKLPFAIICNYDKQLEFAWPTVERVLAKGGNFKS
jgi:hypothetical protein